MLNLTATSLLGLLLDAGEMTGGELARTAQTRIGEYWNLTRSQVYRELAALEAAGLIEAGERGPRDRKPYALTDAGRAAFAAWVEREPGPETIRFPLLLTIGFGRHIPPDQLARIVRHHREVHAERLRAYEEKRRSLPPQAEEYEPYAIATLDFGIAYERAVLSWFDRLPPSIRGKTDADDSPA